MRCTNDLLLTLGGQIYIIGGIVDRCVRPGLTLQRAKELGITALRLDIPSDAFQHTRCLNIDTVVQIICEFAQGGISWGEALANSVPKRKGGKGHS